MASVDNEFVLTFAELLSPLGNIRAKRMFGGFGLYCSGLFFAIIFDDVAYFKGDAQTSETYEAMGMEPFLVPSGRAHLSYFEVPGEWFDDTDQLMKFAHMALGAAHRAEAAKGAKTRNRNPVRQKQKTTE